MSGILECDGVFQVPVPDGWSVTGEPGREYALSHVSEDVGVNISVYGRPAGGGGDALESVRAFALSVGADDQQLKATTTDEDRSQSRAFARFTVDDREWLAAFLLLGHAAVLVSSNSAVGDADAFALGEQVVASLGPLRTKRFGFGRKGR